MELLKPHAEVVGQAANGRDGFEQCRALGPDVALVDVVMPVMDGPACTHLIVESGLPTRVLACTTHDTDEHLFAMLEAGASGFVLKDAEVDALVTALQSVAEGHSVFSPSAIKRLIQRFVRPGRTLPGGSDQLTARETEVFQLVATGANNDEIAAQLNTSRATIKTHVSSILKKLGCRDRIQLVIRAYEVGLGGAAERIDRGK